ncbi:hypothetical protein TWF718_008589 [Orbilia javanica]|uniref:F-box domain-containing protein n=1 Tax=Orbilia javanica TaxID=47235 RepID=A0AAN8MUT6_9PEZI
MDGTEPELGPRSIELTVRSTISQYQPSPKPLSLLDVPDELMLEIASHIYSTKPGQDSRDLNSLSQTCYGLRKIVYPLANRHLWYDEETQFPDQLLGVVLYSFTDPLVEHVKSATFRLREGPGIFWLKDKHNKIIKTGLSQLRKYLKKKAESEDEDNEVFKFFESQIENLGMSILPTVLLFQLKGLKEIELAPTTSAISTRFLLTTLQKFDPPFKIDRLAMLRLVDLASLNPSLLESFLRTGPIPAIGIDYRFGSVAGRPKIKPVAAYPEGSDEMCELNSESDSESESQPELRLEWVDGTGWRHVVYRSVYPESSDDDGDPSELTLDSDDELLISTQRPKPESINFPTWPAPLEEEIEEHYKGYRISGLEEPGEVTNANPGPTGTKPPPGAPKFEINDLRLWMDQIPTADDTLIQLLIQVSGLRRLDLNLFIVPWTRAPLFVPPSSQENELYIMQILEGQKDTLEHLNLRIEDLKSSQPVIESLLKFSRLREIHVFYTSEVIRAYKKSKEHSYFTSMFPGGLELLRIDFCTNLEFIYEAMNIETRDFPNLKVILGIFREYGVFMAFTPEDVQQVWNLMPYEKDPISGLWDKVSSTNLETQNYYIWRRKSSAHIPIQFRIIDRNQQNVWCSHEGWYGPFQDHTSSDLPWNVDTFRELQPLPIDMELEENDYRRLDPHHAPWAGSVTPPLRILEDRRG